MELGVYFFIIRAVSIPCRIKQPIPQNPKYWKSEGSIGDNILKNTAKIGIESVKIMDV